MKKWISFMCVLSLIMSLCGVLPAAAIEGAGLSSNLSYNVAYGCDLSYHNVGGDTLDYSLVDFAKMKADGCQFAILRIGYEPSASNGTTRVLDKAFVEFYNRARAVGMPLGVYFYSGSLNYADAVEDAQWCMSIMEQYDMYFEYPIYYDVEEKEQNNLGSSAMNSLCLGWCETLEAAGYYPGIYAGETQCLDKLTSTFRETYDAWVPNVKTDYDGGAQWNPTTKNMRHVASMWQYAFYEYEYNGIGLPMLDVNVAYKDYPAIMENGGWNNTVTKHTISFESNGGTAVADVKVKEGSALTPPTAPTRYGFDFAGWYCNPELTDPYDFSSPVPYGFTLYAKWDEAYWGANTDLMPKEGELVPENFQNTGETIWPYYNADGSVTLYSGVSMDSAWPTAYMSYEHSFDANNDKYWYIEKDGTAQFNAILTFMGNNGTLYNVYLSEAAGKGYVDYAAGYDTIVVDIGRFIRNNNLMPASGNVKFTKVTYFVIGPKDSYVKLYDAKFTSDPTVPVAHQTLFNSTPAQGGIKGSYAYDNGKLSLTSEHEGGYSVTFDVNKTFDPTVMNNLLMDVTSDVPFNVSMELTTADGTATAEFRNEYYNDFGLNSVPTYLPAGTWDLVMNLAGYFEWHGGAVNTTTVKSVTITLYGEGQLTVNALQASRKTEPTADNDGVKTSGSRDVTREKGDVNGDGNEDTTDIRMILMSAADGLLLSEPETFAADYNGDGAVNTADARAMLSEDVM